MDWLGIWRNYNEFRRLSQSSSGACSLTLEMSSLVARMFRQNLQQKIRKYGIKVEEEKEGK
jgi:phage anti-repressor protein